MDYALLGQWLAKRAEEADNDDVLVEHLKSKVRLATQAVNAAEGDEVPSALHAQTEANWALIRYLASKNN